MALGGGTWLTMNKVLPGSYINFISATRASATLADRGYAALAIPLSWGPEGEVFTVTTSEFQKNTMALFGYGYTSEAMKGLRDLFKNITHLHCYRLGTGAAKASGSIGTAQYPGTRGNAIVVKVVENTDDTFTVTTYFDATEMDAQTVASAAALESNDYVDFKTSATLEAATISFSGGTDAATTTYANSYSTFLTKIEPYSFNAIGCLSTEATIKQLFSEFTKRMRDAEGVKFQAVVYQYTTANHEGVVSVENGVDLVYWTLGVIAGCAVNKSNDNRLYDGEFTVNTDYTQDALAAAVKAGKFIFHRVGENVRVLVDINTLTTYTLEKGEDFSQNQVIRVLDQIGNDIATLFNTRYIGQIPNDAAGRISLWNDIVDHHKQLETLRAIQEFDPANVTVEAVEGNRAAVLVTDTVQPTMAMRQLYMNVYVA